MLKYLLVLIFLIMPSKGFSKQSTAIFAGGCFWCMQVAFDDAKGVTKTTVGYSGGAKENPTYNNMKDHIEAIEVEFDENKISYPQLLTIYWQNINPFDAAGQFADKGNQYKTYIFYLNEKQKEDALESLSTLQKKFKDKKIATKIVPASKFYNAEEYHQQYYKKNETHYNSYKYGSGRVDGLKEIWGD
jgi:methionine-S-sulfoxide reductase